MSKEIHSSQVTRKRNLSLNKLVEERFTVGPVGFTRKKKKKENITKETAKDGLYMLAHTPMIYTNKI